MKHYHWWHHSFLSKTNQKSFSKGRFYVRCHVQLC